MGAATDSPYIIHFDDYRTTDEGRVGGKNASLGTMRNAGLPVPPGFAVTTDAYTTLRSHGDLVSFVDAVLEETTERDTLGLRRASAAIRARIESVPLTDDVDRAIRAAYAQLSQHCGVDDVPVAVRSSATAEDLPDASFAGQQDTYLWIRGADEVVTHVRRCWSSLFTDRAMAYRLHSGYAHTRIAMSVGVQKMVEPVAAGVAFTLNPTDGDRSQIAIDASWGFGEAVASGEVTPDNFLVDKVLLEIVSRTVSCKTTEYRLDGHRVICAPVDDARSTTCCLTDAQIKAVAAMAKRAERHYGRPQDIEWAIDRHLPDGDDIVLLQTRPETVWANKRRKVVGSTPANPLESIVQTLLSPIHARPKPSTVEDPSSST
jgi:pyruvate,water dikinase